MNRVVVLGSNGQLGTDILSNRPEGWEVIPHIRDDWDLEMDEGMDYLSKIKPDLIINTTAFHDVDGCERDRKKAYSVNFEAVKNLAKMSKRIKSVLVHISTDYVFGGTENGQEPFVESSDPAPINTYGQSKLSGENAIREILQKHYIIRISSVFGKAGSSGKGGNFVYTMLKLGKTKDELRVIDDIVMSPTYTVDAAKSIWRLISQNRDFGTYHCNNSGRCSWYEFTKEIFRYAEIDTPVIPVSHTEYPSLAEKPLFSAMGSEKESNGRPWKQALMEFIGSL